MNNIRSHINNPHFFQRAIIYLAQLLFWIFVQLALFIPIVFFCSKHMTLYSSAVLAQCSSLIVGIITLLLIYLIYNQVGFKKKFSYALSFSFAIFPVFLAHIVDLTERFSKNVPYEWGKYTKIVAESYSIPLFIFTIILISLSKMSDYFKARNK